MKRARFFIAAIALALLVTLPGQAPAQSGGSNLTGTRTSENRRQSYSAGYNFVGVAGISLEILGPTSALRSVRVKSLVLSKPSAAVTVTISKRSTACTGGASTNATLVPHDVNNQAATAVVKQYTAAPGVAGTLVGNVLVVDLGTNDTLTTNWGSSSEDQEFVLRAATQTITVTLSGAATIKGHIELLEE